MTGAALDVPPTAVYRFYDAAGLLLYVGVTDEPKVRWKRHAETADWWPLATRRTTAWHDDRRDALAEEAAALLHENPIHNVARPVLRPPYQREPNSSVEYDPVLVALDLVSTAEAAAILGCSRQYIHRLATAGDLPAEKVGSTWVFLREDVDELARPKREAIHRCLAAADPPTSTPVNSEQPSDVLNVRT